jgi:heat shock protein HtpX
MPNLYLLPQKNPTVFATGRDPKHAAVAVTVDILNLDDAKLRSVLGRELSRIKNGDKLIGTIAASAAGAVSVLANIGK